MRWEDGRVRLLPADSLIKTGEVDHADWNFRRVLGWIQRLRFKMLASLLPPDRMHRLLEVGYGSGIFMPELSIYCDELYGIDVHGRPSQITEILSRFQVEAKLCSGSAERLPFPDSYFGGIVAVSCLEFIEDIDAAGGELSRTLEADGRLILVTPGNSPILDFGLKVLTGESAHKDYGGRREALLPALLDHFVVDQRKSFPPLFGMMDLYTALSLRKR